MGLLALIDKKASLIPTKQISCNLDVDLLAYADDLAAELGVPRADVLREAFRDGMRQIYGDWQQALENGAKEAAKEPAKKGGKK